MFLVSSVIKKVNVDVKFPSIQGDVTVSCPLIRQPCHPGKECPVSLLTLTVKVIYQGYIYPELFTGVSMGYMTVLLSEKLCSNGLNSPAAVTISLGFTTVCYYLSSVKTTPALSYTTIC